MVAALGVGLDVLAVNHTLAEISGDVPLDLIAEVRRTRISTFLHFGRRR
jgi:hypothetical protein